MVLLVIPCRIVNAQSNVIYDGPFSLPTSCLYEVLPPYLVNEGGMKVAGSVTVSTGSVDFFIMTVAQLMILTNGEIRSCALLRPAATLSEFNINSSYAVSFTIPDNDSYVFVMYNPTTTATSGWVTLVWAGGARLTQQTTTQSFVSFTNMTSVDVGGPNVIDGCPWVEIQTSPGQIVKINFISPGGTIDFYIVRFADYFPYDDNCRPLPDNPLLTQKGIQSFDQEWTPPSPGKYYLLWRNAGGAGFATCTNCGVEIQYEYVIVNSATSTLSNTVSSHISQSLVSFNSTQSSLQMPQPPQSTAPQSTSSQLGMATVAIAAIALVLLFLVIRKRKPA